MANSLLQAYKNRRQYIIHSYRAHYHKKLSWFVFNRLVKLNSTKSTGKMKKSSFSHSVSKVYVSTLKVISVTSDRAHKKSVLVGVKCSHKYKHIIFVVSFRFYFTLGSLGRQFSATRGFCQSYALNFFYFLQGVGYPVDPG